ncbi:MAG: O-antigen ligase family protein [Patescibacteria group bacterium]
MENALLFLLIVFLPSQLGRHFWPEWSFVSGLRVDYLSPTFYITDGFFLTLWLVVVVREKRWNVRKWWWWLVLIVVGLVVAENTWQVVYGALRIWQVMWLSRYVGAKKQMVRRFLVVAIPWWIGLESVLGVAQIIKGGSLQGVFYWLGERRFDYNSIGTALVSVSGNSMIRAYGTFSHPNSLAGFLLVSLMLWFNFRKMVGQIWWWVVTWLGIIGLIITASRTIWFLLALLLGVWIFGVIKDKKVRVSVGVISMILVFLAIVVFNENYHQSRWFGGWDRNSLDKRMGLNAAAFRMLKDRPITGVGLGNFIVRLPEYQTRIYLQPVHNIGLWWLSQTGLIGGILGMCGLGKLLKIKLKREWLVILGVIGLSGMVDHYWFTLPQNYWLLGLVLGLI